MVGIQLVMLAVLAGPSAIEGPVYIATPAWVVIGEVNTGEASAAIARRLVAADLKVTTQEQWEAVASLPIAAGREHPSTTAATVITVGLAGTAAAPVITATVQLAGKERREHRQAITRGDMEAAVEQLLKDIEAGKVAPPPKEVANPRLPFDTLRQGMEPVTGGSGAQVQANAAGPAQVWWVVRLVGNEGQPTGPVVVMGANAAMEPVMFAGTPGAAMVRQDLATFEWRRGGGIVWAWAEDGMLRGQQGTAARRGDGHLELRCGAELVTGDIQPGSAGPRNARWVELTAARVPQAWAEDGRGNAVFVAATAPGSGGGAPRGYEVWAGKAGDWKRMVVADVVVEGMRSTYRLPGGRLVLEREKPGPRFVQDDGQYLPLKDRPARTSYAQVFRKGGPWADAVPPTPCMQALVADVPRDDSSSAR